jgi:hypothetical protein
VTCTTNGHVSKIGLGGCNLLGPLSVVKGKSIFSLPELEEFHVESGGDGAKCKEKRGLTGPLPLDIATAFNLTVIGAYCNSFDGSLARLALLPKLTILDFHHNNFTGYLPSLACKATLKYISFANNKLEGPIPRDWSRLKELETVGLAYNKLTGSIDQFLIAVNFPGMCAYATHLQLILITTPCCSP